MKERLNWAVLGTGVIANQMAQALQKMGKPLYAVGNRTYEKAVAFAEKYGLTKKYCCVSVAVLIQFSMQKERREKWSLP